MPGNGRWPSSRNDSDKCNPIDLAGSVTPQLRWVPIGPSRTVRCDGLATAIPQELPYRASA